MAETPDIKITIDQDALREQVAEPIRTVMREAAMQLRMAADSLDGGEWWREHQAFIDDQIAKARAEGRAESGDPWVTAPDGEEFRRGSCEGHACCAAKLHEHGCYADIDGSKCDHPDEHRSGGSE